MTNKDAAAGVRALLADQLHRATDLSKFAFSTTAKLATIKGLAAQTRAREAISFGTQVDKAGFNRFVIGANRAHMQETVKGSAAVDLHQLRGTG